MPDLEIFLQIKQLKLKKHIIDKETAIIVELKCAQVTAKLKMLGRQWA